MFFQENNFFLTFQANLHQQHIVAELNKDTKSTKTDKRRHSVAFASIDKVQNKEFKISDDMDTR